jgi:multiple sugar transport system permease protein
MVESGDGLGCGFRSVPADVLNHRGDDAADAPGGAGMTPRIAKALINGLLIGASALSLIPLLWMLSVSFMPGGAAANLPPPLLPLPATLENYRQLFAYTGIGRYLLNSFGVASGVTIISLAFNLTAGYAFAKLHFSGRERIFQALIGALVIPSQVAMMPLFLMLKRMGLVNTYAGVMVPMLAGVFGIFLVRQYARTIPDELLEAARIDGAGELRIFCQIVLPLLKPIVVTLAIFTFLASWNDFMWPLIVLTGQEHYTLPIAIAALAREHAQDIEMMMAGSVITILPVLILFLVLQRYYIQGLLLGSVKG